MPNLEKCSLGFIIGDYVAVVGMAAEHRTHLYICPIDGQSDQVRLIDPAGYMVTHAVEHLRPSTPAEIEQYLKETSKSCI